MAPLLRALLLLCGSLLLLRLDHLLSRSFPLRLLLLTLNLSLVLRTGRLSYLLTLSLGRGAFCGPLIRLLTSQVLQLLACVPIAVSCLLGQIGHLPLTRLVGGNIARLVCCRRRGSSLIGNFEFLSSRAIAN